MTGNNPLVSDEWGDALALGFTAAALAFPVAGGFLSIWTAAAGLAAVAALSWLLGRVLSEPEMCEVWHCPNAPTVKVTDEHGFCAEHASEFYEAVDEARVERGDR